MPKGRDWSNETVTDAQLRAAVLAPATTAYAGTYRVDREARTVTHHIETSLDLRIKVAISYGVTH
jgi:hypothetical protein